MSQHRVIKNKVAILLQKVLNKVENCDKMVK